MQLQLFFKSAGVRYDVEEAAILVFKLVESQPQQYRLATAWSTLNLFDDDIVHTICHISSEIKGVIGLPD